MKRAASKPPLVRRRDACEAAIKRFQGKPFAFGKNDCARMVAFTTRQLGGRVTLVKAGSYSTAAGGVRALKRMGYDSLEAALDGMGYARIPPPLALPGDVLALPSEDGGTALAVALGNGRALAYHQASDTAEIIAPVEVAAAWRTLQHG